MQVGDTVTMGDFTYRFDGIAAVKGVNYLAERATFSVARDGEPYTVLHPERRRYVTMSTNEAAIESNVRGDIYAVIGDRAGPGSWPVRIYHQPLVPWIWLGGLLLALGGVVSLSDRRYRIGVPNRLPIVQATGA
jgi:cytochrome c-type biogenesis protein CcmF